MCLSKGMENIDLALIVVTCGELHLVFIKTVWSCPRDLGGNYGSNLMMKKGWMQVPLVTTYR